MKVALLALEVWMDMLLFPWITRARMGQIVILIGNRKFAEILQSILHDYGKKSFQQLLRIMRKRNGNSAYFDSFRQKWVIPVAEREDHTLPIPVIDNSVNFLD